MSLNKSEKKQKCCKMIDKKITKSDNKWKQRLNQRNLRQFQLLLRPV